MSRKTSYLDELEGRFSGRDRTFALVVSRFNAHVTERLLERARDTLLEHDTAPADVAVFHVPGAWELPQAALRAVTKQRFDAVVALGCVVRGETPHFDYISAEVSRGLGVVARETGVPVIFGVLTTDTLDQAMERSGTKAGNKGFEAGLNALEMANLMRQLPAEDGE